MKTLIAIVLLAATAAAQPPCFHLNGSNGGLSGWMPGCTQLVMRDPVTMNERFGSLWRSGPHQGETIPKNFGVLWENGDPTIPWPFHLEIAAPLGLVNPLAVIGLGSKGHEPTLGSCDEQGNFSPYFYWATFTPIDYSGTLFEDSWSTFNPNLGVVPMTYGGQRVDRYGELENWWYIDFVMPATMQVLMWQMALIAPGGDIALSGGSRMVRTTYPCCSWCPPTGGAP